jgi:curved DNA-binding protein CbpA
MSGEPRNPRQSLFAFVEHAFGALATTDYYAILGVPRAATLEQIKASYYKLASRLHPDLHGDVADAERRKLTTVFSRVVEAYKILSHGQRREQYDAGGRGSRRGGAQVLRARAGGDGERQRPGRGDELQDGAVDVAGQRGDPAAPRRRREAERGGRWMSETKQRPPARNLKVRCATWDQVEGFYARKMKEDRTLVITVPFNPRKGEGVTIALALPNEMVMAIDSVVLAARPAPDGKRAQVRLRLQGMTDTVIGRLRALVTDGRGGRALAMPDDAATSPPKQPRAATEPPAAAPVDAPVDEPVERRATPTVDLVREEQKQVFLALEVEHRRLREAAAHEVLGLAWDADVAAIRRAYFGLVKRHHPDVYAKHRSDAIMHLAEEVFIHVNKAYDRLRDAAMAAGKAIVAGPALLPHSGWLAGMEEIEDVEDSSPVVTTTVRGAEFVGAPRTRLEVSESGPLTVRFGGGTRPMEAVDDERVEPVPLTADTLFGDVEPPSEKMGAVPASEGSQASQLFAARSAQGKERNQVEALEADARAAISRDEYETAAAKLAEALHLDARNRPLRALYHVVKGHELADQGKAVDATTQYETALRHDPDCAEAREALQTRRASKKKGLFGKWRK